MISYWINFTWVADWMLSPVSLILTPFKWNGSLLSSLWIAQQGQNVDSVVSNKGNCVVHSQKTDNSELCRSNTPINTSWFRCECGGNNSWISDNRSSKSTVKCSLWCHFNGVDSIKGPVCWPARVQNMSAWGPVPAASVVPLQRLPVTWEQI